MYLGLATRLTRSGGDTPSLMINLLQNTLDSRLTFSRASVATEVVNGVVTSFGVDVSRVTSAKGLRIEGSRTNTLPNTGTWSAFNCVYTTGRPDPAGGTEARLVTLSAGSVSSYEYLEAVTTTTASSTYTVSRFVKAGSVAFVQLFVHSACSTGYANFGLSGNGTVAASSGVLSPQIQLIGNGWFRVSFSYVSVGTASVRSGLAPLQTGAETRLPTLTWAGTETYETCYAQHESGYGVTSYIPTTRAAATRAADLCTLATGTWLNETEGTVWIEATPADSDPAAATSPRVLNLSGGTSYHEIRRNAADTVAQAGTTTSGTAQSGLAGSAWASGTTARAAYAWKNNDMAFCFAGGTVATDTASPDGRPAGLSTVRLGANSATTGFLFGWVRGVRFWTRRQGNEQLKGMTS